MVITRNIMESRVDAIEQRVGNVEETVEQIRQLVLEQQARPQPRQGRPLGRRDQNFDDEEGSDKSRVSEESRPRHRYQNGGHGPGFYGGKRRLEIPVFKGEDAYGRLVRIERYFRLNEVCVHDKMDAVVLAMEDKALIWCQWWEEQTPLRT
jgi:uncharacterized coiled-coil protein SlyX